MSGLRRSTSQMNLQSGLQNMGAKNSPANTLQNNRTNNNTNSGRGPQSSGLGGLRRTTSRPNLLGSSANLKEMAEKYNQTPDDNGGLSLRRTGSKLSLSDLGKPSSTTSDSASPAQPPARPLATEAIPIPTKDAPIYQACDEAVVDDESPANECDCSVMPPTSIMSPPISPGMPMLHRSRSMNQLEIIKGVGVSEGQKAVESISGKVELLGLNPPPVSSSISSYMSSSSSVTPSPSTTPQEPGPDRQPLNAQNATHALVDHGASGSVTSSATPIGAGPSCFVSDRPPSPETAAHQHMLFVPKAIPHQPGMSPRDDGDVRPEADVRVDYFSHNWNESDIAGSWRYIINRRQDMANSARLENASWRMWAKAKYHLRTVDPSTVNWMKDYDVTWLYGPLYHEAEEAVIAGKDIPAAQRGALRQKYSPSSSRRQSPFVSPRSSPNVSRQSSAINVQRLASAPSSHTNPSKPPVSHLKSILKKKTLAQLMLEEVSELELSSHPHSSTSQTRSTANYLRHHHYRPTPQGQSRQIVADILNRQYRSAPGHTSGGHTHSHHFHHDSAASVPAGSPSPSGIDSGLSNGADSPLSGVTSPKSRTDNPAPHHPGAYPVGAIPASIYNRDLKRGSVSSSIASSTQSSQVSFQVRPRSLLSFRSDSYRSLEGRHVRFNDRVEQCIAVEPENPADVTPLDQEKHRYSSGRLGEHVSTFQSEDDESDDDDDDDDDDEEGGGLFLGLRRSSVLDLKQDPKTHIIAALPATTLKQDDAESGDDEDEYVIHNMQSSSSSRRPGLNAHYTPHPVQTYEIVDPEIQPVKFEAHGIQEEAKDDGADKESKPGQEKSVESTRLSTNVSSYTSELEGEPHDDQQSGQNASVPAPAKRRPRLMPDASFG